MQCLAGQYQTNSNVKYNWNLRNRKPKAMCVNLAFSVDSSVLFLWITFLNSNIFKVKGNYKFNIKANSIAILPEQVTSN